jgi:hypothetical protein
MKLQ